MFLNDARRKGLLALTHLMIFAVLASPAFAQQASATSSERVAIIGGIDFVNSYMFRGIRQDDTGPITWPHAELGLALHTGDRRLRRIAVNVGSWNSLNRGWTGSQGPSGKRWYESDVYTTLGLSFGQGVTLGSTYTTYTSPNDMFSTVKELAFKLAASDGAVKPIAIIEPYALIAFEVDTKPGLGQADGGRNAGKYLEIGATPGFGVVRAVRIAVPVTLGLSAGDYYELAGKDHMFGYFSTGGMITVPLKGTGPSRWGLRGGATYYALGDMAKAINNGERSKVVGSIGIVFAH
jgi:hypothetical protein